MKSERERFLVFYDRLVNFTHGCVHRLPQEMLHWQPSQTAAVSFGERLEDVTIEALYIHLVVGEHLWIRNLRDCSDDEVIPLPLDKAMTADLAKSDYLAASLSMHADNLAIIESFDEDHMTKTVWFSDRKWTVQGFLWAIYGHRNYHIGNIDTYCRLAGAPAPDYFQFDPIEMA
ncbi:DinB family protein [Acidimicrobium ferrooxidans]|uniref:DinB family protein n=1 Tax=Acidimicrobium ferrooxidans TaxID=53635 RepID=A0ABS3APT6_9ACTN|nr:DinB family protein [Acidimicrobium ferrooxidans]